MDYFTVAIGIGGLVVLGLIIFYLRRITNIRDFVIKRINAEDLEKVRDIIAKAQQVKQIFDKDPLNEDIIEKILKYSHYAVLAAEQALKNGTNEEKKKYAMELTKTMVENTVPEKQKTSIKDTLISGLIETALKQVKDQAKEKITDTIEKKLNKSKK